MPKKYDFRNQKYPEEEIRNYIKKHPEECDRYFWQIISWNQSLSENFIREFQDKVCWNWISSYQNLSEKFLIEFIDKIEIGNNEIYGLIDNEKISEKVKKQNYIIKEGSKCLKNMILKIKNIQKKGSEIT